MMYANNNSDSAGGGPKLELKANNRTQPVSRVVFKAQCCGLRTCPRCGPGHGVRVRKKLLPKASLFQKPALLTLTVDRRNFESPEDAHATITDVGYVRRLLKFLRVKRYFWVLEFQSETGAGWPHWHVLVDLSTVPAKRLDLDRAWHLWRDKWGIGGLQLQLRRSFNKAEHAINYITKYLTKYPRGGYPAWVLQYGRRIRFYQPSQEVGAINSSQAEPAEPNVPAQVTPQPTEPSTPELETSSATTEPAKRKKPFRPLVERLAACRQSSLVLMETYYGDNETPALTYMGTLPVRPGRLTWLALMDDLRSPLQVRHGIALTNDKQVARWSEPFMVETRRQSPSELFEMLRNELELRGEHRRTWAEIELRMQRLLNENTFTLRMLAEQEQEDDSALPEPSDDVPF